MHFHNKCVETMGLSVHTYSNIRRVPSSRNPDPTHQAQSQTCISLTRPRFKFLVIPLCKLCKNFKINSSFKFISPVTLHQNIIQNLITEINELGGISGQLILARVGVSFENSDGGVKFFPAWGGHLLNRDFNE